MKSLPSDITKYYTKKLDSCVDVQSMCEVTNACNQTFYKELLEDLLGKLSWSNIYNYICYKSLIHFKVVVGPYTKELSFPITNFSNRKFNMKKTKKSKSI